MQTLSADEIGKSYRGRRVVSGVSFHVKQGEVVGLLGPNGAGKTTSFYIVVGLIPAETGRVLINGQDITNQPMYLRAQELWDRVPAAGAVHLSQTDGRGQHPGGT